MSLCNSPSICIILSLVVLLFFSLDSRFFCLFFLSVTCNVSSNVTHCIRWTVEPKIFMLRNEYTFFGRQSDWVSLGSSWAGFEVYCCYCYYQYTTDFKFFQQWVAAHLVLERSLQCWRIFSLFLFYSELTACLGICAGFPSVLFPSPHGGLLLRVTWCKTCQGRRVLQPFSCLTSVLGKSCALEPQGLNLFPACITSPV